MSGMKEQVRADLLAKYTKFAASLKPMTHPVFRKKYEKPDERKLVVRLTVREEMEEPDEKAFSKLVTQVDRKERQHRFDAHAGVANPAGDYDRKCGTCERFGKRRVRIWDRLRRLHERYDDRKYLPPPEPPMSQLTRS
jgi:uncharacterized protein YifE (UPF0438 family)